MTQRSSVKVRPAFPLSVGVIASTMELQRALRMRRLPDLFELRLDALFKHLDEAQRVAESISAPLIITARDSREGGLHQLYPRKRRELLELFLPFAAYIDVELRAGRTLHSVLAAAESIGVRRIISIHDFAATAKLSTLLRLIDTAEVLHADILKVVTRTDTADDLARLLEFFDRASERLPVAAMGFGKFGRASRRLLACRGSVLNYAHLGSAHVEGQLSLAGLRRTLERTPLGARK